MATDEQKAFDKALANLKDAQDARAKVAADYVRADQRVIQAEKQLPGNR